MENRPPTDAEIRALSSSLERLARALVFAGEDSEDLVQDAWVAALEARRWPSRPLGFLRTVMRRSGARRRWRAALRREREEFTARVEWDEPDDELERACTAAYLARQVRELGSPYSEVLEARYLRDVPAAQIAADLDRPLETVRTQLARGLTRLRERLDQRVGGEGAWAVLLVQASGLHVPGSGETELSSSLSASSSTQLAVGLSSAALVTAVAGLALWLQPPELPGVAPDQVAAARRAPAGAARAPAGAAAAPASTPAPVARLPEPEPEPAHDAQVAASAAPVEAEPQALDPDMTRLVLLVEDDLGQPAPGAYAEVRGRGRQFLHQGPIGPDGRLQLDVPVEDRIAQFPMQGSVTVSARTPGSAWPGLYVAALEPGHERTVRIRLERRAVELRGTVRNPEGEPVPGATVDARAAVTAQARVEKGLMLAPMMVETQADGAGSYACGSLAEGRVVARASAPGYVLYSTYVTLEGPVTERDFVLSRGAVVAGFVSLPGGAPAVDAPVWIAAGSAPERLLPRTRTDGEGFFLMSGLESGTWDVFACSADEPSLFWSSRIEAVDGEESGVEANLTPTTGVRVRVLDASGAPAGAVGVVLAPTDADTKWSTRGETTADGRVVFLHVPDEPLDVRIFSGGLAGLGDPEAFTSGVRAGDEEVVVRLGRPEASGTLRGRVLTAGGAPFGEASVNVMPAETLESPPPAKGLALLAGTVFSVGTVAPDGSFTVDDLPPGRHAAYLLSADPSCSGVLGLGTYTILAGETLDLGERRIAGARPVRFTSESPRTFDLQASIGPYWRPWMRFTAGTDRELAVLPGTYQILGEAGRVNFEVTVEGTSTIEVPVRPR